MDFLEFVKTRKSHVLEHETDLIEFVLGNESCDLDSAVSALAYSYLLQRTSTSGSVYIPVLNVASDDYELKTEVVFLLHKFGVSKSDLLFVADLDSWSRDSGAKVKVHLVDHHVLAVGQEQFGECVQSIVDHRPRDQHFSDSGIPVHIEVVGSCSTLITRMSYEQLASVPGTDLAEMLRGAILCDTFCLSPDHGKTTPTDIEMVEKLENEHNISAGSRQSVLEEILAAKTNVSGLSTSQLLRKDLKLFVESKYTVIMSSMNIHVQVFLDRHDVINAFHEMLDSRSAHIIAVICAGDGEMAFEKHFILYSRKNQLKLSLMERIDKDKELEFKVMPASLSVPSDALLRKFSNTKISRKQVMPRLKEHLRVLSTGDDLITKLRADTDQLTFNLELSAPGTPSIMESPAPETVSSHENSGNHTPNPLFSAEAPPNSYKDASCLNDSRFLPSFNNSEMVRRIMIKKNRLRENSEGGLYESLGDGSSDGQSAYPFTPVNSFSDSYSPSIPIDRHLPAFNSREMFHKILEKQVPMESSADACASRKCEDEYVDAYPSVPFTPVNSFRDAHAIPPIILDQTELEFKLSRVQSKDSP